MADFDAVIVGSGAGGGALAYRLARAGKKVLIIEAGGFYNTNDFTWFELQAYRRLWWQERFTSNFKISGGILRDEVALGMGRCVGGSTTIFTAVAQRALPENIDSWYTETKVVNELGEPISLRDLIPSYELIENETGVTKYLNWDKGVLKLQEGFTKIGFPLEPVNAYINPVNCDHSGCLFGCPTGAKRGSLLAYVIPALYEGAELYTNTYVDRVLVRRVPVDSEGRTLEAYGVEYTDAQGNRGRVSAKIVVLSAGALETPQILLRSNIPELAGHTSSAEQIGRNLAANTATLVFGLFEEKLNNWEMHPLSAHLTQFASEKKGGFLLEMSEVMEGPLGFSEVVTDEEGVPLIGEKLTSIMKHYSRVAGVFISVHDDNNGRVALDEKGKEIFYKPVTNEDLYRLSKAKELAKEGMAAAGAREFYGSIYISHHVQGTCRMGEDKRVSVTNSNCETHDVAKLFVCDGSLIPRVLDANPSLTIYALADRLSRHLLSQASANLWGEN
jgi:choline dehydrogenase-like flavoprotein